MAEILSEAQLLAMLGGPQPEGIAMANLIRTLFSKSESSGLSAALAAAVITGLPTADPLVAGKLYSNGVPSAATPKAIFISGGPA